MRVEVVVARDVAVACERTVSSVEDEDVDVKEDPEEVRDIGSPSASCTTRGERPSFEGFDVMEDLWDSGDEGNGMRA